MPNKKIVYVTTWRKGVSAEEIRFKYFREALVDHGYVVENHRLKVTQWNKYFLYLMRRPPRNLIHLAKKADLIITTSPPLINTIIGHKVAEKHGLPLVVDIRDIWEEYAKTSWKLMSKLGVVNKITRYYYEALGYASKIIVTTDKMREYYIEKIGSPDKIHVVYNGTDPDKLRCINGTRDIDLVYLGDFNNPNQATEFLLYTLKHNNLKLVVIGGGVYLDKLKRIVSEEGLGNRVEFTGKIEYDRLTMYLCRAKVGVVGRPFEHNPQYLYTIPVKIYDYLSAGLPVAGYGPKGSAYGEFILSNNIGVYTWEDDEEKFSNMLVDLVEKSDQLRERARSLALKYDRKKWAKVFAKLIDEVVSS